MEKILIYIKHHLGVLWYLIEWANGFLFYYIYSAKLEKIIPLVFCNFSQPPFSYRRMSIHDAGALSKLINAQSESDISYFHPHGFDDHSIRNQFENRSFLMMGAYDGDRLVGYFFLRFFANKKSFVGRLIDKEYRSRGIGLVMNSIMYEISWQMGFRCLSTISRRNTAVIKAHGKNQAMKVLKDLQNDYLLVEFIKNN